MTPTPVSHEVIDRPCSHTDRSRTTLRPGAEAVGTAVGESLGGARRGAEERGHGRGRGPEATGGEEGEREREPNRNGLPPISDGLPPTSDGLQRKSFVEEASQLTCSENT